MCPITKDRDKHVRSKLGWNKSVIHVAYYDINEERNEKGLRTVGGKKY